MQKLKHLGYIVDGNRRWAKAKGLPTIEGHKRGFDKVIDTIDHLKNSEIEYLSFYIFSTENWNRSPDEISYLMKLVETKVDQLAKKCKKDNLKCLIMGRPEPVNPSLWQKLQNLEHSTSENTGTVICICFNYGGQWEIVDAVKRLLNESETNPQNVETLTPETFAKYLYQSEVPPLDMIVRTSGEQRISGFQLWRAAYAEFLFLDKYFPDLESTDHDQVIAEFHQRQRRFGK